MLEGEVALKWVLSELDLCKISLADLKKAPHLHEEKKRKWQEKYAKALVEESTILGRLSAIEAEGKILASDHQDVQEELTVNQRYFSKIARWVVELGLSAHSEDLRRFCDVFPHEATTPSRSVPVHASSTPSGAGHRATVGGATAIPPSSSSSTTAAPSGRSQPKASKKRDSQIVDLSDQSSQLIDIDLLSHRARRKLGVQDDSHPIFVGTFGPKGSEEESKLASIVSQLLACWDPLDDELKRGLAESRKSFMASRDSRAFSRTISCYGLGLRDVPGDGNCFFHSLVHQLKDRCPDLAVLAALDSYDHTHLRALAVQGLLACEDLHKFHATPNQLIEKASTDREWADGFVITILARVLGITIVLVNSDGNKPTIIDGGRDAVVYLGYQVGVHFQSLTGVPSPDLVAQVAEKHADAAPARINVGPLTGGIQTFEIVSFSA